MPCPRSLCCDSAFGDSNYGVSCRLVALSLKSQNFVHAPTWFKISCPNCVMDKNKRILEKITVTYSIGKECLLMKIHWQIFAVAITSIQAEYTHLYGRWQWRGGNHHLHNLQLRHWIFKQKHLLWDFYIRSKSMIRCRMLRTLTAEVTELQKAEVLMDFVGKSNIAIRQWLFVYLSWLMC